MKATLFVTCLADTFYPEVPRAVMRVLERLGYGVACPMDQTCCGQPMFNAGYQEQARSVAAHFIEVFDGADDPIIAPSSSCAAMVREHYPKLFENDSNMREKAERVGMRTFEFCEFLVKEAKTDLAKMGARFEGSVTYHHSCHFRALGLVDEPIRLIEQIQGLTYIPLPKIEQCCGFGGTFSLSFPHVSREMVADKVRCIRETSADWFIYADPGCAMNITGSAHREGEPIRAMHIAELIERSLDGGATS